MPLVVNTNIASLNTQRQLTGANNAINRSLERLSSGLRINRASDDAAGLAIATRLQAQVRGLQQASRNANNAISLVQTAEGALNSVTNILQRLRELAVQAASDDNTDTDRTALNNEATQLRNELTRLAQTVEFNGTTLLDGTFSGKKFQIGANADQTLTFEIADVRATAIGQFASQAADVGDGVSSATANGVGNLSAGEFSINGTDVLATSDSDDQVSVLNIGGGTITSATVIAGNSAYIASLINASLYINDTAIDLSGLTGSSVASLVTDIASLVNAASITNVTARVIESSNLVFETTAGTNLAIGFSTVAANTLFSNGADVATNLGIGSGFVGSTGTTSAITTYNGQSSALAKAAAINGISSTTGVSATVESNAVTFTNSVGSATLTSGDLFINGVNIGGLTISTNDSNGALAAAINAQSSSTGVKATVSSGKLTLTAADGRNIAITATSAAQTALGNSGDVTFSGRTGVVRGSLTLTSTNNFTVAGTTSDIGAISATTYVASGNLSTLAITSRSSANTAITQIDSALDTINTSRSSIGAVQSRLSTAIAFLDNAAENQAASESRIRDADFALETAQFTRGQILVQAATAILAQANAQPQVALQLLQ
ncbi:flagellin [Candidatus Nitronereus thalassa]|uniref:Flagellin n=1 Tax=Candidatus Nitronereus thalassa TaxID=3020898 RepID=A0ABU3K5Z1_9BACT|nr:flagellin [Candidatus Nitronereus thalassa]MDT7041837.1 flagellin [Candidatus Nitronereus thalassa]